MKICPSILSADFANLESELGTIDAADMVHVDVMDGHFVPNLTIGLPVVSRLSEVSSLPLDVHLMIENVDDLAGRYAEVAQSVTFHFEACKNPERTIDRIRAAGAKAALAIKPNTELSAVEQLLPDLDMLLVMTVEPGFGGQSLIRETLPKVAQAAHLIAAGNLKTLIQVDGGISTETIAEVAAMGANVFVAGSAVFAASDRNQRIAELRALASSAR